MGKPRPYLALALALPLIAFGCAADSQRGIASTKATRAAPDEPVAQIVGMRRLTEAQYRNAIADIFGPDINPAGRFEPIVRPTHQLIATGASSASISPAGLEQFDAMARGIAATVFDDAHRATFVPCTPKSTGQPDDGCAQATLAPIGRYLFRRPLTLAEQAAYVQMAKAATARGGDFYSGLQLALAAMLVSPNFLYVIESAEPDPARPGDLRLDGYSSAARLSFLLWNTTPDDALLSAAGQGRLQDPAQLAAIAQAMVKSPRLEAGVRAFFADMLMFEKFDEIAKDPIVYPRFNQGVAKALPEQLLRTIVDQLVTRDGDYRELFTTRRTFMTRALGPVYNVPVRARSGWELHEFAADDDRAGLLGQAGFLALYAHSGRSSPTIRGRAIRERLLCEPVPDPPGNVNFTVVQDTTNKLLRTARARLSAHATDPACSSCHKITDPLGLPLEHFDGIGAFRATENDAAIDASGTLEGAAFNGASGLGKAIANNPAATECVANRALEYTIGRSTDEEGDALAALEKGFAADGYRLPALMLRLATLPSAYQVRRAPEPKPQVAASGVPSGASQ
ncbi:hypothetical protein GCM10009087_20710 [Sphingomonas oligophenolica]|uniref:DUF1592 domain-containing protein n=1 Tax=Sphingomonas oligophenolica TaxID=301154 RepID=A0ABU9Y3W7_9SPHN